MVSAGSPRAIGRAGTGTVGDDGGGALLVNPAAIARRDTARGQLGLGFIDDELTWHGDAQSPIARNQSPSQLAPLGAVVLAIGPWIVGGAVMTAAVGERTLRRPGSLPPEDFGTAFEYRYAGLGGRARRDTATLGVARRVGDELAIGAAVSASRFALTETRRVWAGFGGRDVIGAPDHDAELTLDGHDAFVPGAVLGLLFAPASAPIELGASIAYSQRARITGTVDAVGAAPGTRVALAAPTAALALDQPLTVRAGARYLGASYAIELGGDLWFLPASADRAAWALSGVRIVDESTVSTALARVPSRASLRTHGAARLAVDVELVGGFLWATGGYAYATGGTSSARYSPAFADLGGHTAALGLEGTAGGVTLTLGWSRTWAVATRVDSALKLDNPFAAGDRAVPLGTYDGSVDQIGILVDIEWDLPP